MENNVSGVFSESLVMSESPVSVVMEGIDAGVGMIEGRREAANDPAREANRELMGDMLSGV